MTSRPIATHLLRLFGATLGAMTVTLLVILAALSAAAAAAAHPTQVAKLALAEAFADQAPLLIPLFVTLGGLLAIIGLLFLLGLAAVAGVARYRREPPASNPTSARR